MTMVVKTDSATLHSGEVSFGLPGVVALRFVALRPFAMHRVAAILAGMHGGWAAAPEASKAAKAASQIDVPRTVITPSAATSLPEMFAEAQARARTGDLEGAAKLFDKVAEHEPHGELAAPALFS